MKQETKEKIKKSLQKGYEKTIKAIRSMKEEQERQDSKERNHLFQWRQ